MAEMTREEARSEASMIALAVLAAQAHRLLGDASRAMGWAGEDLALVEAELKKIEAWLRRQMLAGDKLAEKRVGKELGRQVRPPKGLERQIEALARKAREGP